MVLLSLETVVPGLGPRAVHASVALLSDTRSPSVTTVAEALVETPVASVSVRPRLRLLRVGEARPVVSGEEGPLRPRPTRRVPRGPRAVVTDDESDRPPLPPPVVVVVAAPVVEVDTVHRPVLRPPT